MYLGYYRVFKWIRFVLWHHSEQGYSKRKLVPAENTTINGQFGQFWVFYFNWHLNPSSLSCTVEIRPQTRERPGQRRRRKRAIRGRWSDEWNWLGRPLTSSSSDWPTSDSLPSSRRPRPPGSEGGVMSSLKETRVVVWQGKTGRKGTERERKTGGK